MATDKKFAVAGISTQNGKTKVRFANDAARVKILIKNGHTDIELIDLSMQELVYDDEFIQALDEKEAVSIQTILVK